MNKEYKNGDIILLKSFGGQSIFLAEQDEQPIPGMQIIEVTITKVKPLTNL